MLNVNVSTFRYDEFLEHFADVDRSKLPGIQYRIDRFRAPPLIAYVILFIVGVLGNVWVTCVIGCIIGRSSTRAPRSVQIYILALCCCDLVVLIFSLALIVDFIYGEWLVESKLLCLLYLSSESLNKFCSPFLLVALSHFCYMKICRPLLTIGQSITGHFFDGDVRKTTFLALGCVVSSFLALTPVYIYGDLHFIVYENHSDLIAIVTKCAFELNDPNVLTIFTIYGFVLGYAGPAILFIYFHAAILCRIGRQEANRNVGTMNRRAHAKFLRVTRTILSLVVFYLVCWTPYWSMMLHQALTPLEDQGELSDNGVVLNYFVHMLPYVNCTGYPILYTLMNRDIQEAYKRVKAKRETNGVNSFFRIASLFELRNSSQQHERSQEVSCAL